jgi:hypothetical protein
MTKWIVAGVVFTGTGVLAAAVFFFFTHHRSEHTSARTAEVEFAVASRTAVENSPVFFLAREL